MSGHVTGFCEGYLTSGPMSQFLFLLSSKQEPEWVSKTGDGRLEVGAVLVHLLPCRFESEVRFNLSSGF